MYVEKEVVRTSNEWCIIWMYRLQLVRVLAMTGLVR